MARRWTKDYCVAKGGDQGPTNSRKGISMALGFLGIAIAIAVNMNQY